MSTKHKPGSVFADWEPCPLFRIEAVMTEAGGLAAIHVVRMDGIDSHVSE